MIDTVYRWCASPSQNSLSQKIADRLELSPVLAQLLLNRKLNSLSAISDFLDPHQAPDSQFPNLWLDPICQRIDTALSEKQPIFVYGDYDVDGITSTAILVEALLALGADVTYYIPNRFTDGYGLTLDIIPKLVAAHTQLLITLDCGITNVREIEAIRSETGADVIIMDHHSLPDPLPDAHAILNPKSLEDGHPCSGLCTAGIVYQFLIYYNTTCQKGLDTDAFLDLVAMGTVADMAPLFAQNRKLTAQGLLRLSQRSRLGVRALLDVAEFKAPQVTARDIGFVIGPRINAAGRLDHALVCVELLITKDAARATQIATSLNTLNLERRAIGQTILEDSVSLLDHEKETLPQAIILANETWHKGVIGITASQLVNRYAKPSIVIALKEGFGYGSARTSGSINIHSVLKDSDHLFTKFGGHPEAAGFTIPAENIEALRHGVLDFMAKTYTEKDLYPVLAIDCILGCQEMTLSFAEELQQLAPFGQGNPEPLFYTDVLRAIDFKKVGDGSHLKMTLTNSDQSLVIDGIGFGLGHKLEYLYHPRIELAFHLDVNEWQGRRRVQLNVIDIK